MHDRLVSRRIDALHQCFLVFSVIAFYLCDGCAQVEMEVKTVECTLSIFSQNLGSLISITK